MNEDCSTLGAGTRGAPNSQLFCNARIASAQFLIKEVIHRQSGAEGSTTDIMLANALGLVGNEACGNPRMHQRPSVAYLAGVPSRKRKAASRRPLKSTLRTGQAASIALLRRR
jgi:hypothetical protein